jgi:hypothetical protein
VKSQSVASLRAHHIAHWFDVREVPLALCTDDRGVFDTSLSLEYEAAANAFNLDKVSMLSPTPSSAGIHSSITATRARSRAQRDRRRIRNAARTRTVDGALGRIRACTRRVIVSRCRHCEHLCEHIDVRLHELCDRSRLQPQTTLMTDCICFPDKNPTCGVSNVNFCDSSRVPASNPNTDVDECHVEISYQLSLRKKQHMTLCYWISNCRDDFLSRNTHYASQRPSPRTLSFLFTSTTPSALTPISKSPYTHS